jgi:hypothetical protein
MVGRNDNYGGDFNTRLELCVKTIVSYAEQYELNAEIILVEWNPISDKPSLKEVISWPAENEFVSIRIINVPNEIHHTLENSEDIPLFEYHGKNVGIRRAHGKFVLMTNPDIIFPPQIIRFFSKMDLENNAYYRSNRYDVEGEIPQDASPDDIISYCQSKTYRVHTGEDRSTRYQLIDSKSEMIVAEIERVVSVFKRQVSAVAENPARIKELFNDKTRGRIKSQIFDNHNYRSEDVSGGSDNITEDKDIHIIDNPSFEELHQGPTGDFLLMSKQNWMDIRGCPEDNTNFGMDNQTLTKAAAHGLAQITLKGDMRVYHVDHGKQERKSRPAHEWEERKENMKNILNNSNNIFGNPEGWGLPNENLDQIAIS